MGSSKRAPGRRARERERDSERPTTAHSAHKHACARVQLFVPSAREIYTCMQHMCTLTRLVGLNVCLPTCSVRACTHALVRLFAWSRRVAYFSGAQMRAALWRRGAARYAKGIRYISNVSWHALQQHFCQLQQHLFIMQHSFLLHKEKSFP